MDPSKAAPRIALAFEHLDTRSVITMSRSSWSAIGAVGGQPVLCDVQLTPLAGVASKVSLLAVTAQQLSLQTSVIELYRFDANDAPNIVNLDRYDVLTDFASHSSFTQVLARAGVSDSAELRAHLAESVVLVKQKPGPDHHAQMLPPHVQLLFQSIPSTSGHAA